MTCHRPTLMRSSIRLRSAPLTLSLLAVLAGCGGANPLDNPSAINNRSHHHNSTDNHPPNHHPSR